MARKIHLLILAITFATFTVVGQPLHADEKTAQPDPKSDGDYVGAHVCIRGDCRQQIDWRC